MELYGLLESVQTADWVVNMAFQVTVILLISQIVRRLCVTCSAPTRSDLCFITMLLLLVLPFGSFVSASINSTKIQLMPLTEGRWDSGATPPKSLLSDAGHTNAEQKPDVSGAFRPTHAPRLETRLIYGVNLFGGIWFIGTLACLSV